MTIEILYCDMCGGVDDAKRVAAEIHKYLGVESTLTDVGRGRFEVKANGAMVFSKTVEGRFPRKREIVSRLKKQFR
ncbi:Rdx family protein [Candidatus Magnetobacterium casense]|uniref:SelT/SelW/SelH family protein n=1 Tax=Candidatus Magnetobacterium casense TaxID=1455061 RepID=A0ABS6S2T6_9BACT|nr:Rdx family protein [Candidatus Magnetobacterium casensis]MBV6342714.1 SelT/SelW/SelH family protein [Candidatus Magnetobacterium casensis]